MTARSILIAFLGAYALQASAPASRPAMPAAPMNLTLVKPAAGEEPKIVFDRELFDFGDVDEGPDLETEFPFRNDGPGPLRILSELRHCGCASTWIEVEGKPYAWGDAIAPGARGVVRFVLRTVGYSGEKPSQVDLYTNDPARPPAMAFGQTPLAFGAVPLRVRATIRKLFEFVPSSALSLGQIYNFRLNESVIELRSLHGKPVEIVGFEPPSDPIVHFSAEAVDASKTQWKIRVRIPEGTEPTPITKIVKVLTKPEVPNAMLYVIGTLKGSIDTEPVGMLSLGTLTRGEGVSRVLKVVSSNERVALRVSNLRLLDTRDPKAIRGEPGAKPCDAAIADHVRVTVEETEPGKRAELFVQVKPSMPAGPFSFRIAFETGVPKGPATFSIPVQGLVR